jgi:hypothetical protein
MPALEKNFARIATYIRKLPGCSQPFLAEASDGAIYVVKLSDNQLGENLLFNEMAGTELYRACGLAVASWQPLLVTNDFIYQSPQYRQETTGGRERPAGVFFGSLYLGRNCNNLFEILPGSYFPRVRDAADFWLAWLVDICASHADNRQTIFVERETHELDPVFIDFGHMFGGPKGNQEPHFRASRYLDERIYPRLSTRLLLTIRRAAANLNSDHLWQQIGTAPDEWKSQRGLQNFTASLNKLADSRFVERSLDMMVASIGPRLQDDDSPKCIRHSRPSLLPLGIRAKGGVPRAIA